jgi:TP901 family phage tail tape measure protein
MALNNLGLGLLLSAKDLASGVIDKVSNSFSRLDEKTAESQAQWDTNMALFTKGAVVMGAGITTLMTSYGLAEAAAPFETSLATVQYRTQATAEEMVGLRQAALDASAGLKIVSDTDAARAMAAFAAGGNTASDTATALVPILKYAKANMIDVGQSATFANDMMDRYGITAEQVGEKMDRAQWVMRRFGLGAGDLSGLMGPLAGQAKNVGQSFDDMLLLFGMAAEVSGPRGAMLSLRGAMMQLSNSDFSKKMRENFKGVEAEGLDGKLRPLTELLPDIATKMDEMTEKERALAIQEVFGGRAAGGLAAILDKVRTGVKTASGATYFGADAMRALSGEMLNSAGEVDKVLEAMSPYDRTTQEAAAAWSNLKRTMGESFLPVFTSALQGVGDAVRWLVGAFQSLPGPVKTFLGYAVVATGTLLTLYGAGMLVKGAFGMIKTAWGALRIALTLGPLGGVLLALTAIATVAYLVIDNWEAVKAALGAAWDWLSSKADAAWTSIKETFYAAGRALETAFDVAVVHALRALFWLRDQAQGIPLIGDVIRLGEDIVGGVTGGADATELDRMSRALTDAETLGEYEKNLSALPEGGGGMGSYAPAWGRAIRPESSIAPVSPAYGATAYPAAASAEEEARRTMTAEQLQTALSAARPPPAARGPGDSQTINLQTQVLLDGEVLAQATQKGIERSAQRAFDELVGGGGE